ncbi:MAG: glycerophosphoryl diester phosphodiesterase membrane domain-containing protein [Parabacteroides sp.]|nr:glycerophosphoryl diester phosphodiesterase membrane domain-containing protein [Parabacteroides sp.]
MESKFTISEAFKTSWQCTKSQIWVLAGLLIGFMILSSILSLFGTPAESSITGSIIVSLISLVFSSLFMLGYYKNMFQTLDGEEPQFSAYGQESRKVFTYIIANILYIIITVVGLIFFVIPGIYLAIRLQFYTPFIVEENAGIIESLQKSWAITKDQSLPLFLFLLTNIGLIIVGCMILFVGIFIAIPLIYMMHCYIFRKLNSLSNNISQEGN